MFKLLRYFSLTSLVAIALVTAVVMMVNRQVAEQELFEIQEGQNVELTQLFANSVWPNFTTFLASLSGQSGDAIRARPETLELRRAVIDLMHSVPVLKVKIYDMDGLTIFSTEAGQIGQSKASNAGFLSARAGKTASERTFRGSFSAFEGVVENRDVLASYVPIRDRAGVIMGVFEVYSDLTPLVGRIDQFQQELLIKLAVIFAVLYAVLFFLVRRANRILAAQYRTIMRKREVEAKNRELEQEIEERRQLEAKLLAAGERAELANRAKSEFLANMSHELRTPLNAIIGFSEVMATQAYGPLGNRKYDQYAEDILASGKHLLAIIGDILDLSKVEADKVVLTEQPVDVPELVDACLRLVTPSAEVGKLRLTTEIPFGVPALYADERLLKQMLLNLLSNAIKFTEPGGQVTVRVALDREALVLSVADTGIGIAQSDIETAVAPFGQIDGALTRRHAGTGLGLPLVRSFAELQGATLKIDSVEGQGTTVSVRFGSDRVLRDDAAPTLNGRCSAMVK